MANHKIPYKNLIKLKTTKNYSVVWVNLVATEDDLQAASERLGHSSTSTTQQYYRIKPTVVLPLAHTNQT